MNLRVLLLALAVLASASTHAAPEWTQGRNYFLVLPEQRTNLPPGKVQVTEVFSYGCPACNQFLPWVHQLQASLPPNAQLNYLPAGFIPAEAWPMFERAYITAQVLGVADKTHDAMYSAVWKSGELATTDPRTHRLNNPLPSIEDAARFYNRTAGVPVAKFLATAKSFSVEVKLKTADAYVRDAHVDSTPTFIVNGKYRLTPGSAGGADQTIALIKWLVAKETH